MTVPDTLWATDATEGHSEEGRCAVFVMIDHASGEAWADTGLRMDRFAAADLLREVTTERFGSVEHAVAAGLALRYDGGPSFRSEHYQVEIDTSDRRSPAAHYEPQSNGWAEKFIQTLKEQVLWIERFDTFANSTAPACASSLTTTTSTGCSSATATAPRPKHKHTSPRSPKQPSHDRIVHQSVR